MEHNSCLNALTLHRSEKRKILERLKSNMKAEGLIKFVRKSNYDVIYSLQPFHLKNIRLYVYKRDKTDTIATTGKKCIRRINIKSVITKTIYSSQTVFRQRIDDFQYNAQTKVRIGEHRCFRSYYV